MVENTERDTFANVDAKDGYHVIKLDGADSLTLYGQVYAHGEPVALDPDGDGLSTIQSWNHPTFAEYAECTRLHLCLDAVARYLTTGGSWKMLEASLCTMRQFFQHQIVFQGYELLESNYTTEGLYQHVFIAANGSRDAVLWEEPYYNESGGLVGGFVELTTLDKIRGE